MSILIKIFRSIINNPFFKLKYNFLVFIQVGLGLVNFALTLKIFGVGIQADSFYISMTIISAINLLQLLFIEQFIYFYHELSIKDKKSAHSFYQVVISLTLITQILLCFCFYIFLEKIILIFTSNLDAQRFSSILTFLKISILSIFLFPFITINTNLFNAEMKFSLPYIIQIIPGLANSVILIVLVFKVVNADIKYLAYSTVAAMSTSAIIQIYFVSKIGIQLKFALRHPMLWKFIKNSFTMRFGHNMHGFIVKPIISRVLTSLPIGYASSYSYAEKILSIIQSIIVGPSLSIVRSQISLNYSSKEYLKIKQIIKDYLKHSLSLMIPSVGIAYLVIPFALDFVSSKNIKMDEILRIKYIFAALSVWYLLLLVESPFVLIIVAARNSFLFIRTNTISITIIFIVSFLFKSYFGVYIIPLVLVLGQLNNIFIYTKNAIRIIGNEIF